MKKGTGYADLFIPIPMCFSFASLWSTESPSPAWNTTGSMNYGVAALGFRGC
jgi:hypothetical protein